MKDFDEARAERAARLSKQDREFQIGGQTFVIAAAVMPEVFVAWDDWDPAKASGSASLEVLEHVIGECLADDEQREKWSELRKRREDPVTTADMITVANWMIGALSGRPPTPPGDSSDGPETTGGFSTVVSDSSAETQPALTSVAS